MAIEGHKWFDYECQTKGCQSLIMKSYGRRKGLEEAAALVEELSKAPKDVTWGKVKTAILNLIDNPL